MTVTLKRPAVASGDPFDMVWTSHPGLQNRSSSTWWYFLLCPEQEGGYGPKQIMTTVVSLAGADVSINGTRHRGMDRRRAISGDEESFDGLAVGWVHDGNDLHEEIIHEPVAVTLSRRGWLRARSSKRPDSGFGVEVERTANEPEAMEVDLAGPRGTARFRVWAAAGSELGYPSDVGNYRLVAGNLQIVAWRLLHFEGRFTHPGGTERLRGIGYFQRVCLNVPLFPWKWIWAAFAGGSMFHLFIPYLGPHLLRRGDRFFPGWLERSTLPVQGSSWFRWAGSPEVIEFPETQVVPEVGGEGLPRFSVACFGDGDDELRLRVVPYAHAQFLVERPVLGPLWRSCFNYNEYLFRVEEPRGSVAGRTVSPESLGPGYGNLEYTWGLGL